MREKQTTGADIQRTFNNLAGGDADLAGRSARNSFISKIAPGRVQKYHMQALFKRTKQLRSQIIMHVRACDVDWFADQMLSQRESD